MLFDSGALNVGNVFTWVVADTTGSLAYHCIPHADLGMVGTIILQATGVGEPSAQPAIDSRAFPNPSGAGVVLSFSVPRAGRMVVDVVDAQGRLVSQLYGGDAAAGAQRLAWSGRQGNGARVPAGQYFYRISTDGGTRIGRLTRVQ